MLEILIEEKKYDSILFENIHLTFPDYGFYGIVGESGCGKTTLLNILTGIDQSFQGSIKINGINIRQLDLSQYYAYGFSTNYLLNHMKVRDYLSLYHIDYNQYMDLLDFDLDLKLSLLSRGQAQRISLIQNIHENRPILLLDEITSGQDESHANRMMKIIQEYSYNHLVLMVCHDHELLTQYCEELIPCKSHIHYCFDKPAFSIHIPPKNKVNYFYLVSRYKYIEHLLIRLSLIIILITLSLFTLCQSNISSKLLQAIQDYFPQEAYSFHTNSFLIEDFDAYLENYQVYFCIDDYELMGIKTNKNKLYLMDDYMNEVGELMKGSLPVANNELVIGNQIADILNKEIGEDLILIYNHNNEEIEVVFNIVGINKGNEICFLEGGEYCYLKDLYQVNCSYVIVKGNGDGSLEKLLLKETRPYLKIGDTLIEKANQLLEKGKLLIQWGSILCLLIALFALLEIIQSNIEAHTMMIGYLYLHMLSKKKIFFYYYLGYLKDLIFSLLIGKGIIYGLFYILSLFLKEESHLPNSYYYILFYLSLYYHIFILLFLGLKLLISKEKLLKKIK